MKATLKQYRQSPRKVRLVADLIKGKSVNRALSELKYTSKRATDTIAKLIESAVANAKTNDGKDKENLFIKDIQVNEGKTLYRIRPMSRGRAFRIKKRTSHLDLVLGELNQDKKAKSKKQNDREEIKKKAKKTTNLKPKT